MNILVKCIEAPLNMAVAEYVRRDLSLHWRALDNAGVGGFPLRSAIESNLGITPPACQLFVAGTLSLAFDGTAGVLREISAYTSEERWATVQRIDLPDVTTIGQLVLTEKVADSPVDLQLEPAIWYGVRDKKLVVELVTSTSTPNYVRLSQGLIVGISGAVLQSLVFDKILWE